jgi:hypothetical protein
MDIDEALRIMRDRVIAAHQQIDADGSVDNYTAARMAEVFDAIDGWLSRGGFLPTDWQR